MVANSRNKAKSRIYESERNPQAAWPRAVSWFAICSSLKVTQDVHLQTTSVSWGSPHAVRAVGTGRAHSAGTVSCRLPATPPLQVTRWFPGEHGATSLHIPGDTCLSLLPLPLSVRAVPSPCLWAQRLTRVLAGGLLWALSRGLGSVLSGSWPHAVFSVWPWGPRCCLCLETILTAEKRPQGAGRRCGDSEHVPWGARPMKPCGTSRRDTHRQGGGGVPAEPPAPCSLRVVPLPRLHCP